MTLLAALDVMLHRYACEDEVIVGTNVANRRSSQVEGLIGLFVNNLALRVDLTGNPSFSELLARVRRVCLEAYSNQDVPFERLVDELRVERTLSYNPIFQVLFVLNETAPRKQQLGELSLEPAALDNGTTPFDFTLNLIEVDQGLSGAAIYATDLFNDSTIIRMLEQYRTILEEVAVDPETRIADILLNRTEDAQRLISAFNDPLE